MKKKLQKVKTLDRVGSFQSGFQQEHYFKISEIFTSLMNHRCSYYKSTDMCSCKLLRKLCLLKKLHGSVQFMVVILILGKIFVTKVQKYKRKKISDKVLLITTKIFLSE